MAKSKHSSSDTSRGYRSVADLVARAKQNAADIAPILKIDSPAVEAYVSASVPYTSNVVRTAADLADVTGWLKLPGQPRNNALIDTTTIVTLTGLLAGKNELLTPLTLWDLSRAVTAMVCYNHLFHFENAEVDDESINRELGENVFCALPLPEAGDAVDPPGVRGLFKNALDQSNAWMRRLFENAGQGTVEGKGVQEFIWQWSMILGKTLSASDVINRGDSSDYSWTSHGEGMLTQLWHASRTTSRNFDPVVARGEALQSVGAAQAAAENRKSLHSMITECNSRSYVNQCLASHLQLPYVANTARLPFRSLFYNLPLAVTQELPSILEADKTYAARAAHAKLLRGDPLVLPVFLALALNDAEHPPDVWGAVAELRSKAARFRERRAELDHAVDVGDDVKMKELRVAIGTEAANLTKTLGAVAGAAGKATITSLAAHPVAHGSGHPAPWLLTGLSAAIASAQKLIPKQTARRLIWRLCRPELRFLSDITMDSRAVMDSLPNVQRLWGLAGADVGEYARRLEGFRDPTTVKKTGAKKTGAKKTGAKKTG
jgi:hypothetical protein